MPGAHLSQAPFLASWYRTNPRLHAFGAGTTTTAAVGGAPLPTVSVPKIRCSTGVGPGRASMAFEDSDIGGNDMFATTNPVARLGLWARPFTVFGTIFPEVALNFDNDQVCMIMVGDPWAGGAKGLMPAAPGAPMIAAVANLLTDVWELWHVVGNGVAAVTRTVGTSGIVDAFPGSSHRIRLDYSPGSFVSLYVNGRFEARVTANIPDPAGQALDGLHVAAYSGGVAGANCAGVFYGLSIFTHD